MNLIKLLQLLILAMIVTLCLFGYFIGRNSANDLSVENLKIRIWRIFKSPQALALIQMRTALWYDLNWSNDVVNVNDTMTITGKVYIPTSWPDIIMKPDSAILNIDVIGVDIEDSVFILEKNLYR